MQRLLAGAIIFLSKAIIVPVVLSVIASAKVVASEERTLVGAEQRTRMRYTQEALEMLNLNNNGSPVQIIVDTKRSSSPKGDRKTVTTVIKTSGDNEKEVLYQNRTYQILGRNYIVPCWTPEDWKWANNALDLE